MLIELNDQDERVIARLVKKATREFKKDFIYLFGNRKFRELLKGAIRNDMTIVEYASKGLQGLIKP